MLHVKVIANGTSVLVDDDDINHFREDNKWQFMGVNTSNCDTGSEDDLGDVIASDDTSNASLKHASKNAKKKLRIHQIFSFIFLAEKYSYNL